MSSLVTPWYGTDIHAPKTMLIRVNDQLVGKIRSWSVSSDIFGDLTLEYATDRQGAQTFRIPYGDFGTGNDQNSEFTLFVRTNDERIFQLVQDLALPIDAVIATDAYRKEAPKRGILNAEHLDSSDQMQMTKRIDLVRDLLLDFLRSKEPKSAMPEVAAEAHEADFTQRYGERDV